MDVTEALGTIPVFKSLPAEEIERLVKQSHQVHCSVNSSIVSEQDTTRDVFFVIKGRVRVTVYSESGREVIYRDLNTGEMFGELAAIDRKPRCATVIAIQDSVLVRTPADAFCAVLKRNPQVAMATLCRLVDLVRALSSRVFEFSTLNVPCRIRMELLRLARDQGVCKDGRTVISPSPKHANIASQLSTHREAITREMNNLARAGLIERERGALIITNIERLTKLVEDGHYL